MGNPGIAADKAEELRIDDTLADSVGRLRPRGEGMLNAESAR